VLADEVVVVEMRIRGMDAGDFVALAWAERLVGIEAPNTFEQALAAKNLVQARDAAGEIIGCVEQGCVGIRDFDTFAKKFLRNGEAGLRGGVTLIEQFDCAASPNRPVA